MGLFTRRVENANALTASVYAPAGVSTGGTHGLPIASSTPNSLATVFMPDILGDESWSLPTQAAALSIPVVAAVRNLIVGQISRLPLRAQVAGVDVPEQPTWLYRTNGAISPQMRLALTLDDLIFHGWSLWLVTRGADGKPTDVQRCPINLWSFNDKGQVLLHGKPLEDGILIPGPIPGGFLQTGARTIRQHLDLENTRSQRLRNPSAVTELKLTQDAQLEQEEVEEVRDNWADARRSPNGSVAVTPLGMDVIDHSGAETDFFVETRNDLNVAVAQHLSVSPELVGAAVSTGNSASLTYANITANQAWWTSTGLAFWAEAITARLSMDDCVPRGTSVVFDFSQLAPIAVED